MDPFDTLTETYNNSPVAILSLLNVIILIIAKYCFYFWIFRNYKRNLNQRISAKNFTLLAKVNTELIGTSQSLEELVKSAINPSFDPEVIEYKKINPIYDIKELMDLIKRLMVLEKKLAIEKLKIDGRLFSLNKKLSNYDGLELEKKKLREKLSLISNESDFDKKYKFTGWVFITFKTVQDLLKVRQRKSHLLRNFCFSLQSQWREVPEPNDVIWENWGFNWYQRMLTRGMIFMALLLIIGVNFGMILGLKYLQFKFTANSGEITSVVISVIISLCIGIVNYLIKVLLIYLTKFETYKTKTDLFASIVFKVSACQFVNKALIVLVVNKLISGDWGIFGSAGVTGTIFISMLVNVIIDVCVCLLDPSHLYKLYKQYRVRRKDSQSKSVFLQCEANEAFEGIEFDISEAYYLHFSTIYVAFFYQAILPYGLLVAIIEVCLKYMGLKWVLIKRCKKPDDLEFEFTVKMIRQFEYGICLMAVGFIVFSAIFSVSVFAIHPCYIVGLVLGGLEFFVGINIPILFCGKNYNSKIQGDFESYETSFPVDYDRLNPITQKKAFRVFMERIKLEDPLHRITLDQWTEHDSRDTQNALNEYAIYGNKQLNLADQQLFQTVLLPNINPRGNRNRKSDDLPNLYQFQEDMLQNNRQSLFKPLNKARETMSSYLGNFERRRSSVLQTLNLFSVNMVEMRESSEPDSESKIPAIENFEKVLTFEKELKEDRHSSVKSGKNRIENWDGNLNETQEILTGREEIPPHKSLRNVLVNEQEMRVSVDLKRGSNEESVGAKNNQ